MKSYLSEDTDEENCDDPIKLFDNDLNAVYFGSQPHLLSTRDTKSCRTFEMIGYNEFCQPSENSTLGRSDDDLVQTLRSGNTSECDITPLCVKLVDCGKFPWYYRKYTQQIMHKLKLYELSDSDDIEDDVEGIVYDSDDCFIVEDLQDVVTNKIITSDQIRINTVKSTEPKPKLPKKKLIKSLKNMKPHKDDMEIQKALSMKNLVKIDLKRNQGLVGMKIKQKIGTNTTLDVKADKYNVAEEADAKQTCVIADEKYLSAADETLCHIGTQLIPITEEKESNSICQLNINNKEKDLVGKPTLDRSSSFPNITVQFDISKISEKLIDNLKTKKINEQSSEPKLVSKLSNNENTFKTVNEKELSSKVTITEKCTNLPNTLTSHVKDVKKTNKYKNDQIKIKNSTSHKTLIGLLVTNKTKQDTKEIKCMKQERHIDGTQNKATKLVKKPRKKIEKQKREPKSPILHCSIVPKKPKQHGMPPKCNKTDTNSNISKEPGKLKQIVDKLTNLNSCNLMEDSNRLKHVIPKIAPVTKPFEVYAKQALQKESCMIQDKTSSQVRNINAKSLSISDKLLKNCNEVSKADFKCNNFRNTHVISSTKNKTLNEQNVLHRLHQMNKHTVNSASSITNPSPKAPIKNNKLTVSNSNVSTTAVVTSASGSNAVLSNQYANFPTPHGPHFSTHNAVPSKMSSSNISNNNINVPQNRYASAIILKSNNHTNFPFEKYCEPPVQTMAFQRPVSFPIPVLSHTQPRSRDPQPPYPIFYPPAPLGRHQNNFPSSANSVPNHFHPPRSYIGQQPSNPMQDFYRECWLPQNLAPPPPPPPPPPPSVPPPNIPPRNGHVVNQSKDCPRTSTSFGYPMQNPQSAFHQNSTNTQHTQNSSIIGMNNDGLVKKINIVAMPVKNVGTVKVEQIKAQIMSPVVHSEVVATKTEMLKELDKLSFVDTNINEFKGVYPASVINEKKKENTLEAAIMSNKPDKTLKLTMNQKDNPVQTKPAQGYSPPILPIPTYKRVLDRVTSNPQMENATPKIALRPGDPRSNLKNEYKSMRKRDFVKCCKRKLDNALNNVEASRRKDDAKKISLEEYKKRILKIDDKSEHHKNISKEKYDNSGKRPNLEFKYRKIVDYSTETDLGYDSDSTVVL